MSRIFAALIALVGWSVLCIQLILTVTNPDSADISLAERVARYFSFFTILTNLIVAISTTAIALAPASRIGRFVSRSNIQAAIAVYISIVGIIYCLFLRSVWNPTGWQAVADHVLHDAIPVAFVVCWAVFAPKDGLSWLDPFKWLAYPVAYFIYSIIRGMIVGWYPYWFADVSALGYPTVLRNTGMVLAAFVFVGYIVLGISKIVPPRLRSA